MNYSIFASRTVWTIVIMFIIGGAQAIAPVLPAGIEVPVMGLLGLLATYFHVNPSQTYNAPQS